MFPSSLRRLGALTAASALLLALGAAPASAAGIVVTSLGDGQGNDGSCILREAIINANADNQSGSFDCAAGSGPDTITFSVSGTITLTAALPFVGSDLSINGEGAVTVDGAKSYRPFTITGGTVTLDGLTVTHGKASSDAHGIANGGGIWNSATLAVTNSMVSGNEAFVHGGGIWNATGATLTVTDSTVSGNRSSGDGAGIYNTGTLTVTNSTISENTQGTSGSVGGGGIANGDFSSATGGTVTLTNSTISGNIGWFGGGLLNFGTLTVKNSTISGNEAEDSGGGGLYNFGISTVTNSTISGNLAWGSGGGIANGDFSSDNSATLTVTNSTISGNTTWGFGGGIKNNNGTLDLANTIVAGNKHASNFAAPTASDLYGPLAAGTHNLVGVPAGKTLGDILVLDGSGAPLLASNGGPTETIALAMNSGNPAIDAGDGPTCAAAPVNGLDQRGLPRPVGTGCDIGAYEAQAPPPAPSGGVSIRSKLGLPSSGGSYTTATKVSPLGRYVTWRADLGTAAAGQAIGVWVAARHADGTWGPFSRLTSRLADGSGVATFSLRQSRTAWLSVRFSGAALTTTASQARWR